MKSRAHRVVHLGHPEPHIPGVDVPDKAAAPISRRGLIVRLLIAIAIAMIGFTCEHFGHDAMDARVSAIWIAPFALLLISIAAMPFIARHWWEQNYSRVSVAMAAIVAAYYLALVEHGPRNLARALAEYISFIYLIGSLFIVSGGILIRVRARATPLANTMLLLTGAVIANILGTTGAAMLLIRPYLRMNRDRLRAFHVVFFIFIVANVGGSLTPIGDPPLFLGYLLGVPFFWVFENCWPIWAVSVGALLVVFFVMDTLATRRRGQRERDDESAMGPGVSIYGAANLFSIALILIGVFQQPPWRELLMTLATFLSLAMTPRRVHVENHFNYAPIREVALLFVGIFISMLPALSLLQQRGHRLPLHTPAQYFFTTGVVSAVLDNAPSYLMFLRMRMGSGSIEALIADPSANRYLLGIAMGAVLFGAFTYIGNGPNFMIKSIAEQSKAPVPGFFSYIVFYAAPILLPVLIAIWLLFLR